jgi:energy-converting hydrogenase Eha subunit H
MNQNITAFPTPQRGKISLLVAPKVVRGALMTMIAALAVSGCVYVIDGGNRFDGYALARALRRRTADIQTALKQVWLSRAFTCYQMMAVLAELPPDGTPVIVLDMLATFLDENIAMKKRQRLLDNSLGLLRRISQEAPVAIWVRLGSTQNIEEQTLLGPVLEAAHDIWEMETPERPDHQLPLF